MLELLAKMSGEWKDTITLTFFVIPFVALAYSTCGVWQKYDPSKTLHAPFAVYLWFGIFFAQASVGTGLRTVSVMLKTFSAPVFMGFSALIIGTMYALCFLHAQWRLITFKPDGLRLTRIFLLSYLPFLSIFPFTCFVLCSIITREPFSWNDYKQMEPLSYFQTNCLFAIPWILYFLISPKARKMWRKLTEEPPQSVSSRQ